LPAQKSLRTYPVTERDGRLVVHVHETDETKASFELPSDLTV
jgi:hypothetical protein